MREHRYLESLAEIVERTETGQPVARPAIYKGITFRSHLEVRFARHLDELEEEWVYEPRVYGSYLPDFEIVSAHRPTFIEVKPTLVEMEPAQLKASVIWRYVPDALLMIAVEEGCTFSGCQRGGDWVTWQERWSA